MWTKEFFSVFVVVVVVLLLPGCSAQTEGEYNGKELHGRHADHHADDDVDLITEQHVDLVEAALVHVGVLGSGISDTRGVLGLEWLLSSQNAACLRNLGSQKILIFETTKLELCIFKHSNIKSPFLALV